MATAARNAAQIFTYPLSSDALFVIPASTGVKSASFKCVTGTISVKGNLSKLAITDANGVDVAPLSADYIDLTSATIPEINITTKAGVSALELTVDASASGVGSMICEL